MSQRYNSRAAARGKQDDTPWFRRFWISLALFGLASAGYAAYWQYSTTAAAYGDSAYMTVEIRTIVGDHRFIRGSLALQCDEDQLSKLEERKPLIHAVIGEALANAYGAEAHPALTKVRGSLLDSINNRLPRRLKIEDVLIQNYIVGVAS